MAGRSYDEEDRVYARNLFCASDYQSMEKLVERMRREVPDRYGSLRVDTVNRWRKKDKTLGIDWKELKAGRQIKRAERQNSLAEEMAQDILDQLLQDLLTVKKAISDIIAAGVGGVDKLASLAFAQGKLADRAISILQGKIREVDLTKITRESQVFFIRKIFEDIGQVAGEIDETLSVSWKQHNQSLLARLRGIYADDVITDVMKDLCLMAINARAKELDERGYLKADPDGAGTPGYHGKAAASAD